MEIAQDDWRDGGPWWLMRCLGRYLLAFLVLAPALSLLLPSKDAAGGDGDPTYWQGVGASIFVTWIMLTLVGIWAAIVLLILVGFRRRMDTTSFRGMAGALFCLPVLLMPFVGGVPVTLIYGIVHVLFVTVLIPVTSVSRPKDFRD
ncbi:hypothetical protein OG696_40975 [Streptomyces sp. NBC_00656]|uniref:hypothetical protein n=1 Tax=Streptomyces sp. NBC_00656 TaxID=2903668 RepID=UPI0032493A54